MARVTKERLIRKAIQVYSKKGVAKTTIADIADKAHCSVSQIHYHFKSAKNIFPEVMNFVFSETQTFLNQASARQSEAQTALGTYIESFFLWSFEQNKYSNLFIYFFYQATVQKKVKDLNLYFIRQLEAKIESLLYEYCSKKEIPLPDTSLAAENISQSLIGSILFEGFYGDEENWETRSKKFLRFLDHYLQGFS